MSSYCVENADRIAFRDPIDQVAVDIEGKGCDVRGIATMQQPLVIAMPVGQLSQDTYQVFLVGCSGDQRVQIKRAEQVRLEVVLFKVLFHLGNYGLEFEQVGASCPPNRQQCTGKLKRLAHFQCFSDRHAGHQSRVLIGELANGQIRDETPVAEPGLDVAGEL